MSFDITFSDDVPQYVDWQKQEVRSLLQLLEAAQPSQPRDRSRYRIKRTREGKLRFIKE